MFKMQKNIKTSNQFYTVQQFDKNKKIKQKHVKSLLSYA